MKLNLNKIIKKFDMTESERMKKILLDISLKGQKDF